jgi:TatD DNase family protein
VIDSHTHLDSCVPDNAELVAAAEDAGVQRILTVGMDGGSCRSALVAAETFPQVYAAIGCHPNNASGFTAEDLEDLRALATHERCVAIGESGLDYYRDPAPREDQLRAFRAHIELAGELGKPLVIHTREAAEDTLAELQARAAGVSVILHCFSMPEHLDVCLQHGYAISFAGNVTYATATELAHAAARVPDELLLIETDAPYLTPQPLRGKPNQPAYVAHTAAFVAEQRGISSAALGELVQRNGERIFGW